jgi:phage tail-like protein
VTTTFPPTTFLLSIDGRLAGNLLGARNGKQEKFGLLTPKFVSFDSEWTLQCGVGMAQDFYRWIRDSMQQRIKRRNLQITAVDASVRPRRTWELFNTLLTEITFPALDTLSQGGAALMVSLKAEQTRVVEFTGEDKPIPAFARSKPWPTSRFRLSIDGLGSISDLAAVTRIDALSFRVGVSENHVGDSRFPEIVPTKVSVSSLTLSLPERNSSAFSSWLDASLSAKGTGLNEKSGHLQYLSHDSQTLLTLNFYELGIVSASKDGGNVKVEMYFGKVDMD